MNRNPPPPPLRSPPPMRTLEPVTVRPQALRVEACRKPEGLWVDVCPEDNDACAPKCCGKFFHIKCFKEACHNMNETCPNCRLRSTTGDQQARARDQARAAREARIAQQQQSVFAWAAANDESDQSQDSDSNSSDSTLEGPAVYEREIDLYLPTFFESGEILSAMKQGWRFSTLWESLKTHA